MSETTLRFLAQAVFAPYWIFGSMTGQQAHERMARKLGLPSLDLDTADEETLRRVISICIRKGDPHENKT